MKDQYKITKHFKKYGISKNNRCAITIRLHTFNAALKAIELLKTGIVQEDINNNGIFHKDFRED